MNEIKPVAWVCDSEFFTDQQMAQVHRHFRLRKGLSAELLPLYDQQSIDTLRAEVEENEAVIRVWRGRTLRAEAEAEALRKDAERYRWLRMSSLDPQRAAFLDAESTTALDAAIDAAKQAAE